jgi:hypothetical protein
VIKIFLQNATQVENHMQMCDDANVEYETKNQQRLCEALKRIVPALTALDTLKEFMLDGDWVEIRRGTSESFCHNLSKVKPHTKSGRVVTSIADSAPDTVRAAGLSEGSIVSCAQVQKKDFCGSDSDEDEDGVESIAFEGKGRVTLAKSLLKNYSVVRLMKSIPGRSQEKQGLSPKDARIRSMALETLHRSLMGLEAVTKQWMADTVQVSQTYRQLLNYTVTQNTKAKEIETASKCSKWAAGGVSTVAFIGGTVCFIVFPPSAPAIAGAYGLCAGSQLTLGVATGGFSYLKRKDQKAMKEVSEFLFRFNSLVQNEADKVEEHQNDIMGIQKRDASAIAQTDCASLLFVREEPAGGADLTDCFEKLNTELSALKATLDVMHSKEPSLRLRQQCEDTGLVEGFPRYQKAKLALKGTVDRLSGANNDKRRLTRSATLEGVELSAMNANEFENEFETFSDETEPLQGGAFANGAFV